MDKIMDPGKFVGRAPEQVDEFLRAEVDPVLEKYKSELSEGEKRKSKISV
jgi:adenylosuccinate lyase